MDADIETEAKTIVGLIRSQNWKNGGVLMVDEPDAVRLVMAALECAESRGRIAGMERMSAVADKVFAPATAP